MKLYELFEAGEQAVEKKIGLNFDGPSGKQDLALARLFRTVIMSRKYREELEEKWGDSFAQKISAKNLTSAFMQEVIKYLETGVRMLSSGSINRDASQLSSIRDKAELDEIKNDMRAKYARFFERGIMEAPEHESDL